MQLNFTLIDYTVNPLGITTAIPEPYKWDSIQLVLKRDSMKHGFIDIITGNDGGFPNMEFTEKGFKILKDAFDNYGVDALVNFKIEFSCSDTDSLTTLYEGKVNFSMYREFCGDSCGCMVGVDSSSEIVAWKNRNNQKVNLRSLKSFDSDTDNLDEYENLGIPIVLPPKAIKFFNDWEIKGELSQTFSDTTFGPSATPGTSAFMYMALNWDRQNNTEIIISDNTPTSFCQYNKFTKEWSEQYEGMIKFDPISKLDCTSVYDVKVDMEAVVSLSSANSYNISGLSSLRLAVLDKNGNTIGAPITLGSVNVYQASPTDTLSIHTTVSVSLKQTDRLYLYFVTNIEYLTFPFVNFDVNLVFAEAKLNISSTSYCEQTKADVFLVNEVMSRITEAYTNDKMRVYSDYFGRTDAKPYSSESNGCGGLECLTNGLQLRQFTMSDGSKPLFAMSMNELFEGLNPIHNIGMGLEDDPNRVGYKLVRVEPFIYFYKLDVIFTAKNISLLTREANTAEYITSVNIGYDKWEAERVNGIDEIQTKRSYRTALSSVRSAFERISKFIASGYAIEVTRREYGATTKDWRYDNDNFIICLNDTYRGGVNFLPGTYNVIGINAVVENIHVGDTIVVSNTASNDGTYIVTLVTMSAFNTLVRVSTSVVSEYAPNAILNNTFNQFKFVEIIVDSPENLLTSDVVYNFRISPLRNAMRWFKTIVASIKDYAAAVLIFTGADGNSTAKGQTHSEYGCIIENDAYKENSNIEASMFTDSFEAIPILENEKVHFDYPLTYNQWTAIMANPYGLIEYSCGETDLKQGWIEDLKYSPYTGLATFTLRPKI